MSLSCTCWTSAASRRVKPKRPALEFAVSDDNVEAPPPSSAPAARVQLSHEQTLSCAALAADDFMRLIRELFKTL